MKGPAVSPSAQSQSLANCKGRRRKQCRVVFNQVSMLSSFVGRYSERVHFTQVKCTRELRTIYLDSPLHYWHNSVLSCALPKSLFITIITRTVVEARVRR